jgi:hypothetical protein
MKSEEYLRKKQKEADARALARVQEELRKARAPARVPRSSTATGISGDTPSAISFSAMSWAVATPI